MDRACSMHEVVRNGNILGRKPGEKRPHGREVWE